MMAQYIQAALETAEYKKLDDGSWFASVPDVEGVWANGITVEQCRRELVEVLEEWLLLKVRDNEPLPVIQGEYRILFKDQVTL